MQSPADSKHNVLQAFLVLTVTENNAIGIIPRAVKRAVGTCRRQWRSRKASWRKTCLLRGGYEKKLARKIRAEVRGDSGEAESS